MTIPQLSAPARLRPRDISDLTIASGFPSISVMLPTTPAPRMLPGDIDLLHELVRQVGRECARGAALVSHPWAGPARETPPR